MPVGTYIIRALIILSIIAVLGFALHVNPEPLQGSDLEGYIKLPERCSTLVEIQHDTVYRSADTLPERSVKIIKAVEIIRNVRKSYSEAEAFEMASLLYDECSEFSLPYSYVLAVVHSESRFSHKVTSSAGAQGVMQIMPKTFVSISKKYGLDYKENDVYDMRKNIKVGCAFIHRLTTRYNDFSVASAAYNGGPGAAAKFKANLAIPSETDKYIKSVANRYKEYRRILGE